MATQTPTQTELQIPNDRRERAKKEVRQLIENRNNVLAQYYNLVKQVEDFDNSYDENDHAYELLQEFCQELVDYLAIGHFGLYRRIEEGNERRDEILKLANDIMPKISITTQIAIAFNDLFDNNEKVDNTILNQLPNHLTQLGEQLATRIDLEDLLINKLLTSSIEPGLRVVNP